MNNIEIGEYYRCNGEVHQVKLDYGNRVMNELGNIDYKEEIKIHNKNKIKLVELGDYVNGERICTITTDNHLLTERNENILDKYKDIETIVTHEQFKEMQFVF